MALKIGVISSCIMDLTFEVATLPQPGETISAENFHTGFGGKGANQAVAAAKTGGDVRVIGAVGKDDFGDKTISNFQDQGIDSSQIFQFSEAGTGLAAIYVDRQGENSIGVAPRANRLLSPEQIETVPRKWFEEIGILAGVLEINTDVLIAGFRRAKQQKDTITILNAAPAREIPPELWELIDILIVNETEAQFFCGQLPEWDSPEQVMKKLHNLGPTTVVLTLGKSGAISSTASGLSRVTGEKVTAVDTTGAGDAFIGRYLSALAQEKEQLEAIQLANSYAAQTVQKPGTQKSFPILS